MIYLIIGLKAMVLLGCIGIAMFVYAFLYNLFTEIMLKLIKSENASKNIAVIIAFYWALVASVFIFSKVVNWLKCW